MVQGKRCKQCNGAVFPAKRYRHPGCLPSLGRALLIVAIVPLIVGTILTAVILLTADRVDPGSLFTMSMGIGSISLFVGLDMIPLIAGLMLTAKEKVDQCHVCGAQFKRS